jgi:hypothetical protein
MEEWKRRISGLKRVCEDLLVFLREDEAKSDSPENSVRVYLSLAK